MILYGWKILIHMLHYLEFEIYMSRKLSYGCMKCFYGAEKILILRICPLLLGKLMIRYLDECFDLSAAVADSGTKLYECFRATNQLEDYLAKIKHLSILSLKQDNLGTGIGTGLSG